MAVIKGTDGDDTLTGGAGTDMLLGGDGDDTLVSNGGVDILYGGEGADRFVVGDAAGYTWIGDFEAGTDTIDLSGLQRDLTWEDVSANMTSRVSFWGTYVEIDLTEWGGGTVAVYGVTSPDQLTADSFTLPARDAPINEIGGDGDDTIIGDMGNDWLLGWNGDDNLYGHEGNDRLHGGTGDDFIAGGSGDDTIIGSTGDDTLYGNGLRGETDETDRDTFVYAPGHGNDTIMDFRDGEDRIDLRDFNDISGFGDISAHQDGNNTVIRFSDEDSITLANFHVSNLDADDFIF